MVPTNDVLLARTLISTQSQVFDHVFVCIVLGVDSGLGSFYRQSKGICHNERILGNIALHETHDFDLATGAGVHDHLDEGDGADAHLLEVVRVVFETLVVGGLPDFVVIGGVTMQIDKLDIVVVDCRRRE